jgi:two-component system NarL family sensor kinase
VKKKPSDPQTQDRKTRDRLARLTQANQQLTKENKELQAILDSSPSIIFLKDRDGRYLYVNPQFQKLCDTPREQIAGKTDHEIFPPEQASAFRANDLAVLEAKTSMEFEEIARHEDGPHTSIVHKFPLRDAKGCIYAICGFVIDITERKRAESRLVSLIENSPLGIVVTDHRGRIAMCNPAFERLFLFSAAELKGLPLNEVISTPEMQAEWKAHAPRIQAGETVRIATRRRRKDGAVLEVEIHGVPLMEKGHFRGAYGLYQDITERTRYEKELRHNEESLRQLSTRLLHSQDEERRRVARELHDSTSQTLVSLIAQLYQVKNCVKDLDETGNKAAAQSLKLAEELEREIRTVSYLLHPPILEEAGLVAAIRWYADGFRQRSGVRIAMDFPAEVPRLPKEKEMAFFRIVQEGLTNIHRHSGSPLARIRLEANRKEFVLEVADVGHGMSAGTLERFQAGIPGLGVGIAGMRERMRQLGGRLEIESSERGTVVTALLPAV